MSPDALNLDKMTRVGQETIESCNHFADMAEPESGGKIMFPQDKEEEVSECPPIRQLQINHLFNGFSCPTFGEMKKIYFSSNHRLHFTSYGLRMRSKTTWVRVLS